MQRRARAVLVAMLATGIVGGLMPAAHAEIVVGDRFNGAALRPAWKQVDAAWRIKNGAVRVKVKTVDPVTNIGYAVIGMKGTHRSGLRIQSQVRLSPGKSNVGIVGPFKDVENHLFCKVEVTPAHPLGLVAIGRRLKGNQPTLLKARTGLHLTAGEIYRLVTERHRKLITCALWQAGVAVTTLRYTMRAKDIRAFGGGTKAGFRTRVVARGTRRDEDDGRSKFLDFRVSTI